MWIPDAPDFRPSRRPPLGNDNQHRGEALKEVVFGPDSPAGHKMHSGQEDWNRLERERGGPAGVATKRTIGKDYEHKVKAMNQCLSLGSLEMDHFFSIVNGESAGMRSGEDSKRYHFCGHDNKDMARSMELRHKRKPFAGNTSGDRVFDLIYDRRGRPITEECQELAEKTTDGAGAQTSNVNAQSTPFMECRVGGKRQFGSPGVMNDVIYGSAKRYDLSDMVREHASLDDGKCAGVRQTNGQEWPGETRLKKAVLSRCPVIANAGFNRQLPRSASCPPPGMYIPCASEPEDPNAAVLQQLVEAMDPQDVKALRTTLKDRLTTKYKTTRDAFRAMDTDHSGTINQSEMKVLMRNFGLPESSATKMFQAWGKDEMPFGAFCDFITEGPQAPRGSPYGMHGECSPHGSEGGSPTTRTVDTMTRYIRDRLVTKYKTLREAFRVVDLDKDGTVSKEEVRVFMRNFGISKNQAESFFDRLDADKSGALQYGEFVDLFKESVVDKSILPDEKILAPEKRARIEALAHQAIARESAREGARSAAASSPRPSSPGRSVVSGEGAPGGGGAPSGGAPGGALSRGKPGGAPHHRHALGHEDVCSEASASDARGDYYSSPQRMSGYSDRALVDAPQRVNPFGGSPQQRDGRRGSGASLASSRSSLASSPHMPAFAPAPRSDSATERVDGCGRSRRGGASEASEAASDAGGSRQQHTARWR